MARAPLLGTVTDGEDEAWTDDFEAEEAGDGDRDPVRQELNLADEVKHVDAADSLVGLVLPSLARACGMSLTSCLLECTEAASDTDPERTWVLDTDAQARVVAAGPDDPDYVRVYRLGGDSAPRLLSALRRIEDIARRHVPIPVAKHVKAAARTSSTGPMSPEIRTLKRLATSDRFQGTLPSDVFESVKVAIDTACASIQALVEKHGTSDAARLSPETTRTVYLWGWTRVQKHVTQELLAAANYMADHASNGVASREAALSSMSAGGPGSLAAMKRQSRRMEEAMASGSGHANSSKDQVLASLFDVWHSSRVHAYRHFPEGLVLAVRGQPGSDTGASSFTPEILSTAERLALGAHAAGVDLLPTDMLVKADGRSGTVDQASGVIRYRQKHVQVYGKVVLPFLLLWAQLRRHHYAPAHEYTLPLRRRAGAKKGAASAASITPAAARAVAVSTDCIRAHWMSAPGIMAVLADITPNLGVAFHVVDGRINSNAWAPERRLGRAEAAYAVVVRQLSAHSRTSEELQQLQVRPTGTEDWCSQLEWCTMVLATYSANVNLPIGLTTNKKTAFKAASVRYSEEYQYEAAVLHSMTARVSGLTCLSLIKAARGAADKTSWPQPSST